jgi:hypothetical protein
MQDISANIVATLTRASPDHSALMVAHAANLRALMHSTAPAHQIIQVSTD